MQDVGLTLSILEKYLLKHGWQVKDEYDHSKKMILTRIFREGTDAALIYPKPLYHYIGLDTAAILQTQLTTVAAWEGLEAKALSDKVRAEWDRPPEGFVCKKCGLCCRRFRDAFQGVLSEDEVRSWRTAGRERLLGLTVMEKRSGYELYKAWVNPKTGRYLKKCPWLTRGRSPEEGYFCRIHPFRPLKCQAFPLSREQAEYSGCPGFE
ncbi:MAG: YkgJ family cysteine cluster protein [Proteobacteria bacterium]|nr:YkgJ family cysteine cluster protein [Pseudomonadota bacterium]